MNSKILKEIAFGAVGGVAGTVALGGAMGLISRLQSNHDKWIERELVREQPPQKLARQMAKKGLGIELSSKRKQLLGNVIRWGYGISWGAIYALMRNRVPGAAKVAGLPFGVVFGLFGPAFLLPAFGLTPSAREFPISTHVRGLLSHYAYAATVEGVITGLETIDHAVAERSAARRTKGGLREVA